MDEIVVYGAPWCGDCRRAQRVLDRHGARYRYVDVDEDPEAAREVVRINRGLRSIPTIIAKDPSYFNNGIKPSNLVAWKQGWNAVFALLVRGDGACCASGRTLHNHPCTGHR